MLLTAYVTEVTTDSDEKINPVESQIPALVAIQTE